MRVLFGFPAIVISIILTVLNSFFGLNLPAGLKGLINSASFICVLGTVLGGCLVAYGSDTYKGCGAIFKPTLSREEAAIAVDVYKLAVRMSIGSGFIGVMFGLIAMLGSGGGSDGVDMGALAHGVAVSLVTTLYGLVFAFTIYLPLQCYCQYQLGKDS